MSSPRLLTLPFGLAFAASFFSSLALFVYLHLPGLLHDWGSSEGTIGLVMSAMALSAVASRPTIGWLMDRRGRRLVALLGGSLHIVACALYLLVDEVGPELYAVRIVHGVAEAALFSVVFTIAADVVPASRRTEGMALFGISGIVPVALGPVLGKVVLDLGGFTALFYTSIGLAVAALLVILPLPETRPEPDGPVAGFWTAAWRAPLRPIWLLGTVYAIALTAYFTFLKTYTLESGLGGISTFFLPYAAAAVFLRIFFGWVPDRFGPKRTLLPAVGVTALGLVILWGWDAPAVLWISGLICGVGHGYAFPIMSALVVDRADASERGAAITVFTALFDVGALIGGPSLGALVDATDHRTMFLAAAAVAVTGLAVFVLWDRGAQEQKRRVAAAPDGV